MRDIGVICGDKTKGADKRETATHCRSDGHLQVKGREVRSIRGGGVRVEIKGLTDTRKQKGLRSQMRGSGLKRMQVNTLLPSIFII